MNKENPLWMPPGSVRAILTVMVTVRVLFLGAAPAYVIAAFSTLLLYYFASKAIKEFKK